MKLISTLGAVLDGSQAASATAAGQLPVRVDRATAATIVTNLFFKVSPRTIEKWPLAIRHVNGRALIETSDLLALARAKLDEATPLMGGRQGRRMAA